MKIQSISVLPNKPYAVPSTESFFPIICNHFFGRLLGLQEILPLNILGQTSREIDKISYLDFVHRLGIHPLIWEDFENKTLSQELCDILIKDRVLHIRDEKVWQCFCGIAEIEDNGFQHIKGRYRTLRTDGNIYFCSVCNQELQPRISKGLYLSTEKILLP